MRKYSPQIRKAADWLMARCQTKRDGLMFSEHPSEAARYMQGHGLAVLFLAGARKHEPDAKQKHKILDALTHAVKYTLKARSTQGGWYVTSRVEGHDFADVSATVIQIQALQAAENTGISLPEGVVSNALDYLKTALGKSEKKGTPGENRSRAALLAAALAARDTVNRADRNRSNPWDDVGMKWFAFCQKEIPVGRDLVFGRDELTHHYYAQAVFKYGEGWSEYRTAVFDHLQGTQNKDGSWPACEGIGVGPVYATALWCTVLQLDHNSHPSTREVQLEIL
jgi:hypothetical protein